MIVSRPVAVAGSSLWISDCLSGMRAAEFRLRNLEIPRYAGVTAIYSLKHPTSSTLTSNVVVAGSPVLLLCEITLLFVGPLHNVAGSMPFCHVLSLNLIVFMLAAR